jgi:hypothetical protein
MNDRQMTDKEMDAVMRTWMEEAPAGQPDRSRVVGAVISQLGSTRRRRRRWWPFATVGRNRVSVVRERVDQQPDPIPVIDERTSTVRGRTRTMFSPGKIVVAGTLAFAIGGALYVARPVEQPAIAPAAQGEPVAPTWVTGSMVQVEDSCSELSSSVEGGFTRHSYECTFAWTSSDPRLTGDALRPWNEDSYQADEGPSPISVSVVANYLKNDGGDWTCSTVSLVKGSTPTGESFTDGDTYLCVGGGGYEGLSAVLVSKYMADGSFGDDFSGLIFSGELPPLPEPPAAE